MLLVEQRFGLPDGYGYVLTNGTGTGKTYSGLGVAKRYARRGKHNILIVVPDQPIAAAWLRAAGDVELPLTALKDTKDAGQGPVVTTYANLRENNAVARRAWDLVIADEAHEMSQNAEGDITDAGEAIRALTLHPEGVSKRAAMMAPDTHAKLMELQAEHSKAVKAKDSARAAALEAKLQPLYTKWREVLDRVRGEVESSQLERRPRLLALSATPFAYEKSVNWANGYLFDWDAEHGKGGDMPPRWAFMIQHFGYRVRYNKLTEPDGTKVDSQLMQRGFNTWLKNRGVLSGRLLDVDADYDRRFVAANSEIGRRIDQAMRWFFDTKPADLPGMPVPEDQDYDPAVSTAIWSVRAALNSKFDYLSRLRLLEAMKAQAAVPYIAAHLDLGRKVVVFHDLIRGQKLDPFTLHFDRAQEPLKAAVYDAWRAQFADLVDFDWSGLKTPIETMREAFGAQARELNGQTISKKQQVENIRWFNEDDTGPAVLVVQSDKDKGWSGHDTTGAFPRVLINLGLPNRPTRAIQQEGRIYREGQVSNAMLRYFNTQTAWEQAAFAFTLARRASAAENLSLGELARGLQDAYVEAFEDTDTWEPGFPGEGTGGKARDREMAAVTTDWDRAKTYYWAKLKKTERTKAQEGKDWFATPEPLGMKMVEWADPRPGESFLEPSAGDGAIARWAPETLKRTAIEPSPTLSPRLALAYTGDIREHSFEALHAVNKADVVVMNPPFNHPGAKGSGLAFEHLAKAYNEHLNPGGRIVALLPEGPAADARLDKFLNGVTVVKLAPVMEHPKLGPIYKGDVVETTYGLAFKVMRGDTGSVLAHRVGSNYDQRLAPQEIASVKVPGKRDEERPNAPGASVVSTIHLPADTFGRAGTNVRTRIVVIDKLEPDQAPAARNDLDLSDLPTVEALFDRIKDLELPERTKPRPIEVDEAPAEKPVREETEATAEKGRALAKKLGLLPVEHVVKKTGKTLEGVILRHVQKDRIQDVAPYSFSKDGGVFVRMKHLPATLEKFPLPALSTGGAAATSTTVAQLQAWVDDLTSGWTSPVAVRAVASAGQLPEHLQRMLGAMSAQDTARGMLDPSTNTVFLVADRIADADEAAHVLFHETYGHLGLRHYLGSSYETQMGMLRAANPRLAAEADAWAAEHGAQQVAARMEAGLSRPDAERLVRALAVEEALAERAPTAGPPKAWKLIMAALQRALRSRFGNFGRRTADWLESMTQAETHELLMQARLAVTSGAATAAGGMPALSQARVAHEELPSQPKPSTGLLDRALRLTVGQFGRITGPGYDLVLDWADRQLMRWAGVTWEHVKAGLQDNYGLAAEHHDRKTDMFTAIRVEARKTGKIVEKLRALSLAESRVAYFWMGDQTQDTAAERALFDGLPEESRALLQSLKDDIEFMGREAVDLGLLTPEVFERNRWAYLHRSYQRHVLDNPQLLAGKSRATAILGDSFKARGMRFDATSEQVASADWWRRRAEQGRADTSLKGERFVRLERRDLPDTATPQLFEDENGQPLGRLRQVVYWPAGEPIPARYADWRNDGEWEARFFDKAGRVGMWRDFTLAERTKLGEIQEVRYAVATTTMQMVRDIETARFLKWVAENESVLDEGQLPEGATPAPTVTQLWRSYRRDEWVQVPDSTIRGTGLKRYGKLAGRWVPGPVWNDIRQITILSDQSDINGLYQKVLRAWKVSKTALSPVTHMNNVMSNFVLADFHDIQARHIYGALQAALTHKTSPVAASLIERYRDNGGDAGLFNEAEIRREIFEPLLEELRREINAESGTEAITAAQVMDLLTQREFGKAWAVAKESKAAAAAAWGPKKLMKLYSLEDEWFRLAAFIKATEDGLSDRNAGRFARDSFLNYEINAPWINAARKTVLPFVSFVYRAAPMLARIAAEKPHKLAKLMLLATAANAFAYWMLGAGGDEDKERALMPDEKSGRVWGLVPKLIRLPFNDRNGNPVFLDVRRWVPVGDIVDVGQSQSMLPLPPPLVPGGPAVLAAEFVLNSSGFTGQDVVNRTDDLGERFSKTGAWLWRGIAPNMPGIPGTYATQNLVDAARGRVSPGPSGQERTSLAQAVAGAFGVKADSYPIESLNYLASAKVRAEVAEIMNVARRDIGAVTRSGMDEEDQQAEIERIQAKAIEKVQRRVADLTEKQREAGLVD